MKAVIVCPGPSLARLDALPPADIVIGVNRAAMRFACHWFAASDYPTIRDWRLSLPGEPKLYTRRQTWADIANRGWFNGAKLIEDLACPVPGWADKTATAALWLAWHLLAKEIIVYGADFAADEPDWDGVQVNGSDRGAKRFAEERKVWDQMVQVLAEYQVSVERR